MDFKVGYHIFLRVIPNKSSHKIGSCAKLVDVCCRLFELLYGVRLVSYRHGFPTNVRAYNFFHIYVLRNCANDPNHFIDLVLTT